MMYCGFIIEYSVSNGTSKREFKFVGPYDTIEETHKNYEQLKSLEPAFQDIRICRLVCEPHNPRFYK